VKGRRKADEPLVNFQQAFQDVPVGLAVGRNREILAFNREFADLFRAPKVLLEGMTFEALYPSKIHYETTGQRVGRLLSRDGRYADDRVMRRLDGELFWVHVRGITYTPADPHKSTLWVFNDLSTRQPAVPSLRGSLTARERDVAALLIEGKTGKEVARALRISPRTVDIYKTRLLRKFGVTNTPDLVTRLLTG
jgi:PAS domain S-box-containing protein